ncbi:MAG: hypothetical protein BGO01_18615 [Armatimonadetes bacterium 55-13]|nr:MAG: hypothetical protein BGO01_18615 [Armatimonadetes bacterium 55-13]
MIRKPRPLEPGDVIALVSPASPLPRERTDFMRNLLESEGYKVVFANNCFDSDFYLAGDDLARASDLMQAFLDPGIDAVMCTRGGYGCARLFPFLNLDAMAAQNKMFLGFSDITTLHIALNNRGLATYHAPMALTLHYEREPWVYESLKATLRGEDPIVPGAPKGQTLVPGIAEGPTVGGCLCLLTDSLGTPNALNTEGKLLIIEDVDENPHRIDAMLTHLVNSGTASQAAGFVIGEMTRTDERVDEGIGGKPWREIVRDRIAPLGKPTVIDFPFGHCKNMLTLPLGIQARLDATAGTLTYLESPCA